jgi:hypothetical protein
MKIKATRDRAADLTKLLMQLLLLGKTLKRKKILGRSLKTNQLLPLRLAYNLKSSSLLLKLEVNQPPVSLFIQWCHKCKCQHDRLFLCLYLKEFRICPFNRLTLTKVLQTGIVTMFPIIGLFNSPSLIRPQCSLFISLDNHSRTT